MKKLTLAFLCAIGLMTASELDQTHSQLVVKRLPDEQVGSTNFSLAIPDVLEIQTFFPSEPFVPEDIDSENLNEDFHAEYSVLCAQPDALFGLIIGSPIGLDYDLTQPQDRERYVQDAIDDIIEEYKEGNLEGIKLTVTKLIPLQTLSGEWISALDMELLIPCELGLIRNFYRIHVLRIGIVVAMAIQLCPESEPNPASLQRSQQFLDALQFDYPSMEASVGSDPIKGRISTTEGHQSIPLL